MIRLQLSGTNRIVRVNSSWQSSGKRR